MQGALSAVLGNTAAIYGGSAAVYGGNAAIYGGNSLTRRAGPQVWWRARPRKRTLLVRGRCSRVLCASCMVLCVCCMVLCACYAESGTELARATGTVPVIWLDPIVKDETFGLEEGRSLNSVCESVEIRAAKAKLFSQYCAEDNVRVELRCTWAVPKSKRGRTGAGRHVDIELEVYRVASSYAIRLRAHYGMSGTDRAYGATQVLQLPVLQGLQPRGHVIHHRSRAPPLKLNETETERGKRNRKP
eukprot:1883153-Rhodomonas_salina.1